MRGNTNLRQVQRLIANGNEELHGLMGQDRGKEQRHFSLRGDEAKRRD
jgi:hypothetical protein